MEVKIITDLSVIPQEIEFNSKEIKSELAPKLEFYKNLVVTENSIKDAKSDRAKLNKLKSAFDEKRKELKKICLAPYEKLEKEFKEITSMIDEASGSIDEQVKEFEEIAKKKKYDEIKEYYDSLEKPDYINLESVLNPKWANSTVNIEGIKQGITENISRIIDDMDEISQIYGDLPIFTAIKNRFTETLDKSATLAYATMLERECREEQEQKSRIQAETSQPVVSEPEKIISGTFEVSCTKSQLISLRDFMKNNGITFKIVK